MRTKVNVTKRDIANGLRFDCQGCPIAIAVRRALRLKKGCQISAESVGVFIGQREVKYRYYGKQVTEFMFAFDRKASVKPFSFSIRRVSP